MKKIIQRWVLAVFYFSTNGEDWEECSRDDEECPGTSFLSIENECEWFGIQCVELPDGRNCVEEIVFEENGLSGTIPTELALLPNLMKLGMEQGTTTGRIPSELGELTDMVFIDLDFNQLTGSLPPELYQLTKLTTLDLNVNSLTGILDPSIGRMTDLNFVQLQDNQFVGTIPTEVGDLATLRTFNVHKNEFSGEMPDDVCDLKDSPLTSLIADCKCKGKGTIEKVKCKKDCCSGCDCDDED
mmetsp:Transcript_24628/g.52498  ORF Transcript_24628/g.52498 Transcript_24628/m.52498 type:complete len:242 (+) Transcript_24628:405-1130(+)